MSRHTRQQKGLSIGWYLEDNPNSIRRLRGGGNGPWIWYSRCGDGPHGNTFGGGSCAVDGYSYNLHLYPGQRRPPTVIERIMEAHFE